MTDLRTRRIDVSSEMKRRHEAQDGLETEVTGGSRGSARG